MTTPWRSVQDAEKANETVAWQRCHAVHQRVAYPNTVFHVQLAVASAALLLLVND